MGIPHNAAIYSSKQILSAVNVGSTVAGRFRLIDNENRSFSLQLAEKAIGGHPIRLSEYGR